MNMMKANPINAVDSQYEDMIRITEDLGKNLVYLYYRIGTIYKRVNDIIELMVFVTRKEIPHPTIIRDVNLHLKRIDKDLDDIKSSISECSSMYASLFITECSKIIIKDSYDTKFEEFYYYANLLISECSSVSRFVKRSKEIEKENNATHRHIFEVDLNNPDIQKKLKNIVDRALQYTMLIVNEIVIPVGATTFAQEE